MSAEKTLGEERQAGKRVPGRFRGSPAIEGMAEPPPLYYELPMHLKMLIAAVFLVACSKSQFYKIQPVHFIFAESIGYGRYGFHADARQSLFYSITPAAL